MTTAPEPDQTTLRFEPSNRIAIADLSPSLSDTSRHILANVALVWPYSSSTGTLALLLADPDIRARKSKGQVKVIFRDGSAREVARTQVGIGDTICLALTGCEWEETGETISTPGKKIDWDLQYRKSVLLRVLRGDKEIANVDYTSIGAEPSATNGVLEVLRSTQDARPLSNGVLRHEPSTIRVPLLTPSKSRQRVSGGYLFDVLQDIRVEDDGYVHGRGRKRTKFARDSGAWSLVDTEDQQSPQKPAAGEDENEERPARDQASDLQVVELSSDSLGQEEEAAGHVNPAVVAGERPDPDRQDYVADGPVEHECPDEAEPHTEEQRTTHGPNFDEDEPTTRQENEANQGQQTEEERPAEGKLTVHGHLPQDGVVHPGSDPAITLPRTGTVALAENDVESPRPKHLAESTEEAIEVQPAIMGPPRTTIRMDMIRTHSTGNVSEHSEAVSDVTTTPRLHPLASPGLPLVSPLVQRSGVDIGYFPPYRETVSQLDASSTGQDADTVGVRRNILEAGSGEVTPGGRLTMHIDDEEPVSQAANSPSPSDMSVVFVQENNTQTLDPTQSSPQDSHEIEPLAISQDPEPVSSQGPTTQLTASSGDQRYESTITERWLSSTEFVIDSQLSQREESPVLAATKQTVEVVELEDDDLYGPHPESAPKPTSPAVEEMPLQLQRSPLDVVEQFLQSASTGGFAPTHDDAAHAVSSPNEEPGDQSSARDGPETNWEEKITLDAVECNSPGNYPPPPFPSQQHWHRPKSSRPNSRRSSAIHTPIGSFDGNVDEREAFPTDREEVFEPTHERLPSSSGPQAMLHSAADDIEMQERNTAGGAIGLDVEAQEDIRAVEEHHGLSQGRLAEHDSAVVGVDMPEAETGVHEATLTIGIVEERRTISFQDELVEVAAPLSPQLTDAAVVQLPTPDQTQRERYSHDHDHETESVPEHPDASVGIPSPLHTQEGTAGVEVMKEVVQVPPAEMATPTAASTNLQVQPDNTATRRISQRLSARRSIMPNNISSPYFNPRKLPRAPSSSPTRKENIKPSTSRLSSPISSPPHGRTKSPLPLQPFEEEETETVLVSRGGLTTTSREPPKRQGTGTTTSLAYYPRLASLHEHFGQLVDVIGVCVEQSSEPERSKLGPKDYYTTLQLADSSVRSGAVTVQIFRPVKTALAVARRGDVVLLRNFKVQTLNRTFMLVSSEASSWAVFQHDLDRSTSWSDVIVAGPPVEYGSGETATVNSLLSWWVEEGQKHLSPVTNRDDDEEVHVANGVSRPPTSKKKPGPRSRREANMTDNIGGENEQVIDGIDVGDATTHTQPEVEVGPGHESPNTTTPMSNKLRRKSNVTDNFGNDGDAGDVFEEAEPIETEASAATNTISNNNHRRESMVSTASSSAPKLGLGSSSNEFTPRRSARHRRSQSVIHELRDGTKYVDDDRRRSGSVVHELRDGATYVDD